MTEGIGRRKAFKYRSCRGTPLPVIVSLPIFDKQSLIAPDNMIWNVLGLKISEHDVSCAGLRLYSVDETYPGLAMVDYDEVYS